ncbi:MAG: hypothetical protein CSA21_05370 [Deltaproteobacteria bacterium]|nr:MAG: hypothetical protein CSA21_05370 [Deltaproteobacteria bacterium]
MTFIRSLLLFFCAAILTAGHATAVSPTGTLLVSQDFTEALVRILAEDTGITTERVIPAEYSQDLHHHYLKKHWDAFSRLAGQADGVVTIASAWPDDPLYPWARRANIRIVHIDAVRPLDNSRAGLPLLDITGGKSTPPVWYSPGNTARMADIVAADMIELYPGVTEKINRNLNTFKRLLFKLRSRYEHAFGLLDTFEVVALTTDAHYLADEFGIIIIETFLKPELRWQQQDIDRLTQVLEQADIRGVICAWEPKAAIKASIDSLGAKIILLKKFMLTEAAKPQDQLLAFYATNLKRLLSGLQARQ